MEIDSLVTTWEADSGFGGLYRHGNHRRLRGEAEEDRSDRLMSEGGIYVDLNCGLISLFPIPPPVPPLSSLVFVFLESSILYL